jgi:hypothetical protein
MRHLHRRTAVSLLVLALAACQTDATEEEPSQPSQDVMRSAPIYQPARMIASRGSAETLEWAFRSPSTADSVASWYRARITAMGWDISGDAVTPDGAITLHAQRDGAPLWVIIRETDVGSEFSVIGAALDTSTGIEP